jgi:hypothetical protein
MPQLRPQALYTRSVALQVIKKEHQAVQNQNAKENDSRKLSRRSNEHHKQD